MKISAEDNEKSSGLDKRTPGGLRSSPNIFAKEEQR